MAINKVANHTSKTHGGLRNVLEYALRDEKVKQGYVAITGTSDTESINYDDIYKCWLREKRMWNKDSGRMYAHNIISFHPEEHITPEQCLQIGIDFANQFFADFQCVIAVHQDKEHCHCHIITNTVSYIDGHKLHQTKADLQEQKDFTNKLCKSYGLSVAEKGKHFDGTAIEPETIRSWDKNTYKLLTNDTKKSYLADLAIAIHQAKQTSYSKEDFISAMEQSGWSVIWSDKRKHITFQDTKGHKVRDTTIEKTFADMHINKESLEYDFNRKAAYRQQLQQIDNTRRFTSEIGRSIGQNQATRNHHISI